MQVTTGLIWDLKARQHQETEREMNTENFYFVQAPELKKKKKQAKLSVYLFSSLTVWEERDEK